MANKNCGKMAKFLEKVPYSPHLARLGGLPVMLNFLQKIEGVFAKILNSEAVFWLYALADPWFSSTQIKLFCVISSKIIE